MLSSCGLWRLSIGLTHSYTILFLGTKQAMKSWSFLSSWPATNFQHRPVPLPMTQIKVGFWWWGKGATPASLQHASKREMKNLLVRKPHPKKEREFPEMCPSCHPSFHLCVRELLLSDSIHSFLKDFYWNIVDLQCSVVFCYTAKWISYTYT